MWTSEQPEQPGKPGRKEGNMCLLIVKPAGQKAPGLTALKRAEVANPHGIGIAQWRKRWGHVLIRKDFKDAEALHKWMIKNVKESDALIIHFRYATSGLVDAGNRHPFPVSGSVKAMRKTLTRVPLVVAHNGVFSQFKGNATESDTMEFIRVVLSGAVCRTLKDTGTQALLKDFLRGQRVAFMDKDGEITIFGDFHICAGVHYSNRSYEAPKTYSGIEWDDEEKDTRWTRKAFSDHWTKQGYAFNKMSDTPVTPTAENTSPAGILGSTTKADSRPSLITSPGQYNELTNCDLCGKYTTTREHAILGGYLCQPCEQSLGGM
jgi:hypothetical protein